MTQAIAAVRGLYLSILQTFSTHHSRVMWIAAISYRLALDFMYVAAVSYQYAYAGLTLSPNGLKYVLSWILYLTVFACLPAQENSLPALFLHLQSIIIVAPMMSFYALNDQSSLYMFGVTACVLIQAFILRDKAMNNNAVVVHIPRARGAVSVFSILFLLTCTAVLLVWNGFYGIQAFDLNFLNAMRNNATYPPLFSYFSLWAISLVLPFFLAYSLHRRRYWLSGGLVIITLLLYMVMGNKYIYLSLIVVLGLFVLTKTGHPLKFLYLGFGALSVVIGLIFTLERFDAVQTPSTLLNFFFGIRFLFGPAYNKFSFFEFFSQYPKLWFSDGQIGRFLGLTYPYAGTSGQIIFAYQEPGRFMSTSSNTGYFGDSYAQLGFVGMLLICVLLAYFIKFIAKNSARTMFPVFAASIGILVVLVNDLAFFTTLLSHGMIWLLPLAMVYSNTAPTVYLRRNL